MGCPCVSAVKKEGSIAVPPSRNADGPTYDLRTVSAQAEPDPTTLRVLPWLVAVGLFMEHLDIS
ncbi:MAG: hypothetical protein IT225_07800, partial [Flavobacteriales bacterium]|nr:hypothetical protein [Flavobacteriales bacterium]